MGRMKVSPERYRLIAWTALAVCTLIVFTGAAVRLTGSGPRLPGLAALHGTQLDARAAARTG